MVSVPLGIRAPVKMGAHSPGLIVISVLSPAFMSSKIKKSVFPFSRSEFIK